MKNPKRIPTGIPGLDEIINGGFIEGSIILVAGHPGAGKTTLAATFVYNGITKHGETGVYLNFNESKSDFYSHMKNFSMDFAALEREGKFIYIDALTVASKKDLEDVFRILIEKTLDLNAKRVVIDPITVVLSLMSPPDARSLLANTIGKLFKGIGTTTMLIADLSYGEMRVGHGVEEFVSDVVLILRSQIKKDRLERTIEIRKIRGSPIYFSLAPYVISERGVEVISPLPVKIMGSFKDETCPTGIDELDNLLGGGISQGSITVIVGPTGTDKTLLVLQIALTNVLNENKKVLFLSFCESEEQLLKRLKIMGCECEKLADRLKVVAINPFGISEYEILLVMRRMLREFKPDIYIIDGLEVFHLALGTERFFNYVFRRLFELKNAGITTIITMNADYPEEKIYLDNLVDNILVMKIIMRENRLEKYLYIWKLRGKKSPVTALRFEENEKGRIKILK